MRYGNEGANADVLGQRGWERQPAGSAPLSRAAQSPAPRSGGGAEAVPDAPRRRWPRAIMRARMRSPVCIRSRCSEVQVAADFAGGVETPVGFFLLVLLIPLLRQVSAGADRLPAVACGFRVFSSQSAGWENRALSLERDFIDVAGRGSPLIPRSLPLGGAERVRLEVRGLYRKVVWAQVADAGRFQAESQGIAPLRDEDGEHFVSRAGCGKLQVARQVARDGARYGIEGEGRQRRGRPAGAAGPGRSGTS